LCRSGQVPRKWGYGDNGARRVVALRRLACWTIGRPFPTKSAAKRSGGHDHPSDQQPDGGETPGVAVAPVALAGAIMLGFARFIVTASLHAAEFGVGTTVRVGSMLVLPSSVISGWIVPGGGLAGISGVESGNAAPVIDAPAKVVVHAPAVVELPSGVIGVMVPVALPLLDVEVVTDGAIGKGAIAAVLAAGAPIVPNTVEVDRVVAVVPPVMDIVLAITGFDVMVCDGDREQLTLVPAMVGSSASGTGARVVSGAPGCVAAEKGPGPVRGDDTIAPGVDGIPMAVVPMVETCATQVLPPSSNAVIAYRKVRIAAGSCQLVGLADCRCGATLLPSARLTIGLRIT
jgi:hypothetical protein